MRNTKLIKEATLSVFDDLFKLSPEEFHAMLDDDSELGPVGSWLYETNTVETILGKPLEATYTRHFLKSVTVVPNVSYQGYQVSFRPYQPSQVPSSAADNYYNDEDLEWQEAA